MKELCRQKNLKVSGLKSELINRLKEHEISLINQPQFISDVEITNELYLIADNLIWHIKCSVVKMDSTGDMFLICKDNNKHSLVIFEQLINNGYCLLEFDGLAE